MSERKPGRAPDDAVAYYCHSRLSDLLRDTDLHQKDIAEAADLPRSAISHLMTTASGIGPSTAKRLAGYLGFETRGALVDAADAWWEDGGYRYAIRFLKESSAEKVAEKMAQAKKRSVDAREAREKKNARQPSKKRQAEKLAKTGG